MIHRCEIRGFHGNQDFKSEASGMGSDVVGYHRFGGPCCIHLQVMTPCSDEVGHHRFEGPCCLHLQVVKPCSHMTGPTFRKTLLSSPWIWRQQGSPKRWYLPQHYTAPQLRRRRLEYIEICLRTGCWRKHLDLRRQKWSKSGEDFIMRSFITCKFHQIFPGSSIQGEWDWRDM